MNIKNIILFFLIALFCISISAANSFSEEKSCPRQIISLDGTWDIAEGSMDQMPDKFAYVVPVPGLVDMSSPDFFEAGIKSKRREAFWYHKTFNVEGTVPESAVLKIHKAMFGAKVFLNGKLLGEHLPLFTPGYFDVKEVLKGNGEKNELIIRVGAYMDAIPKTMPNGWDFEKYKYIPGIYDSVELILTGSMHIVNIQTAPDIENQKVRIQTGIQNIGEKKEMKLQYQVREACSKTIAAQGSIDPKQLNANELTTTDFQIDMPNCHLWTPEDPFLYELEISTGTDTVKTRFAMRSFRFDPDSKRAILNGKPYYMRGTNVCIYRFFEDASRGNLPWSKEWVRDLHKKFKTMNWNSIRYCIGFPPEFWYDIADEVGLLIQDEFSIWYLGEWPKELKSDAIAAEYTEWMRERWNHACVVIWDGQNESQTEETGKAIRAVRKLDLSNRPWDNGWGKPEEPGDSIESHPYFFIANWQNNKKPFKMESIAAMDGKPGIQEAQKGLKNAIIINEYAWLWINRDGSETCLTRNVYNYLLGPDSTTEQRREFYARYFAAKTEFWRSHRECAAVMHFCGLGYSRPGGIDRPTAGATSDNFIDLQNLIFEPYFEKYVKDSFAPEGIMIDVWKESFAAGESLSVPVYVISDLYENWKGLVRLRLTQGDTILSEQSQVCEVNSLGRENRNFQITLPKENADYTLTAELVETNKKPVQSIRKFKIIK